ncbi:MAG TPA: response regulator [Actinomycetota bacterium]|jgi:diguanylate cyclase (GGDEF)-like protein|nr:response regulator [Actinomycetota bacterium]
MSEPEHHLVLVADDDEDIVRFVEVNLRLEGFRVATASDGEEALRAAYDLAPDLVLLDVMMPEMDGFEVCQRLRSDARTRHISVIMLTAKSLSADKVVGLTAGADDYMIKPFDPIELIARVKSALRRSQEMRDANPLTQLPGNVQVQEEVARRVAAGNPFALMYIDLDNFKAFNDHYGFLRGDEAIKLLARCASEAVDREDGEEPFLGHVGGDDFVVIADPPAAERLAQEIIGLWDERVVDLYDAEDVERGYIEVADRRKQLHRFPFTTVSIGIASNTGRVIDSHWAASEIAAEMKAFAKNDSGSSYAIDRRRTDEAG